VWFLSTCLGDDILFYTVFDRDAQAIGIACYLRINPSVGSIEVGWISMSQLMKRTVMSTEAMYLMMQHIFDDLGYRRYEWKCDSLNAPSRVTAQRLGFQFEGIFRNCTHYKGHNQDTA
jgi:RimJ/RimL family protein N-acetyltransferase